MNARPDEHDGTLDRPDPSEIAALVERLLARAEMVIGEARALQREARRIQSLVAEARVERNNRRGHAGLAMADRRRAAARG